MATGIKASEKPISESFAYVYAEKQDSDKSFVKVPADALKKVLAIPTKFSDLENDKGFIDKDVNDLENYYSKNQTYSKKELEDKLSLIPKFSVKVVQSLPNEDISDTTIYLVKELNDENNLYTEYIYADGLWEILGTQKTQITVDNELNEESENPIQNKAVSKAISNLSATVNDCVKTVNGKTAENGAVTISGEDINYTIKDLVSEEEYEYNVAEALNELIVIISSIIDPEYANEDIVISVPIVGDVSNATVTLGERTATMRDLLLDLAMYIYAETGKTWKKAVLEGGVLNFYNDNEGDAVAYRVDLSSLGGSAEVTKESIETALGYTPANAETVVTDVLNALPTWQGGSY